jgi:hypothetical protein
MPSARELQERKSGFVRFEKNGCPICGGKVRGCAYRELQGSIDLIICHNSSTSVSGYTYKGPTRGTGFAAGFNFVPNESLRSDVNVRPETKEEREARQKALEEQLTARKTRQAGNPSEALRHTEYSKLIDNLSPELHPEDAKDLERRGISVAQAQNMGVRSIAPQQIIPFTNASIPGVSSNGRTLTNGKPGYIVPIRNPQGQILGFQLHNRNKPIAGKEKEHQKYLWISSASKDGDGYGPALASDHLPLAFVNPKSFDLDLADYVGLCEGTGVKVSLAADRFGIPTIGASGGNFIQGDPGFFNSYYEAIGRRNILIEPDGGAIHNPDIVAQYEKVAEFVKSRNIAGRREHGKDWTPIEIKVAWWQQFTKADADPDEFVGGRYSILTWEQWYSCTLGGDRQAAQSWMNSRIFTANEKRDSRYCDFNAPEYRQLLCIKAGLGLGKTERILRLIAELNAQAIVFAPTNNLCLNFNERASEMGIQTEMLSQLAAMDETVRSAAQSIQMVTLCPDSILSIDPESVRGKIVVIDEANETGLAFRQRPTHIKKIRRDAIEYLIAILHLAHSVVILDGNLTDDSCKWYSDLCPSLNVHKVEFTHKSSMNFEMNLGTKDDFLGELKYQIKTGVDRIVAGMDSAADAKAASKLAICKETVQEGAIGEDGSLIANWTHLAMKNPLAFIKEFQPDCLTFSPACGSGVNFNIGDYFKKFFLLGTGVLGVDGMLQISARDRNTASTRFSWIAPKGLPQYWAIDKESCLPSEIQEAYARHLAEYGALMGAPGDAAFEQRKKAMFDFIQTDPTASAVQRQTAFTNFEQRHLRGCFIYALISSGHSVSLELPVQDDDRTLAADEHKEAKKEIKTTKAAAVLEAPLISDKEADVLSNATLIAPGVRAQLERNAVERVLPGIGSKEIWTDTTEDEKKGTIANVEFVKKAHKIARRASQYFFLVNPSIAKRRGQKQWDALLNSQWIDLTTLNVQYAYTSRVRKVMLKHVPDCVGLALNADRGQSLAVTASSEFKNLSSSLIKRSIQSAIVNDLRSSTYRKTLNGRSHSKFLRDVLTEFGFDVKILKNGDITLTAPFAESGTVENQCYECVCDRFAPPADEPEEMTWTTPEGPIATSETEMLMDEFSAASEGIECEAVEEDESYTFEVVWDGF